MSVRAKFLVKALRYNHTSRGDQNGRPDLEMFDVEAEAVNACNSSAPQPDPEDEDSVFGYYTPSGEVRMTIRGDAARFFEPGTHVYATFSRAPTRG